MRNLYIYKPLTASILLGMMAVSASTMAAEPSDFSNQPSNDQATELLKRENQSTLSDPTAPSNVVSSQEAREAINSRQQLAAATAYNLEALKADPVAFSQYLNAALAAQDMETVKQLLPHYKALKEHDPMLINFADALVYRSEAKNKQAIAIYRTMLAADPDFHPVRLNMAMALQADKQYAAAKDQLQKLKAVDLPPPVLASVQNSLTQINELEEWRFDGSISYVRDDNINDVPSRRLETDIGKTPEQISANGIQVSGSANKRINLPQNFYATVGGNASLRGYWDESDYNDYLLTASTGVGYDDAKNDISVTPFFTKRIYDEDPYSSRKGVTLSGSRWIKPSIRLTATGILSNETIDDDEEDLREIDGRYLGLNTLYLKDPTQYFYGGIDTYRNDAPKSNVLSYDRHGINVGWGREWKRGISTLATVGYAVKNYDDVSGDFPADSFYYKALDAEFGSDREDKTASLGLQIWKRDFTLYGLTPRLVMNYDQTSSNYGYYDDRNEKSATVLLTKTF